MRATCLCPQQSRNWALIVCHRDADTCEEWVTIRVTHAASFLAWPMALEEFLHRSPTRDPRPLGQQPTHGSRVHDTGTPRAVRPIRRSPDETGGRFRQHGAL